MTRRAFSAVEVLMTLGIIAVTAGISVPTYRNFQIRNDLDLAVAQTVHGLARAQLLSQTGQRDGAWGFRVPEGTVFLGDNYVVRDTDADEVVALPQGITVYGVEEVVFARVTGTPSVTGDIIFEAANGEQRTVTVSSEGVLIPSGILPPDFGDLDGDEGGSGDVSGDTGDTGSSTDGSTSGSTGGSDTGDTGSTSGSTGGSDSGGSSGDTGDTGSTSGTTGGSDSGGGDSDDDDGSDDEEDDTPTCEDRFSVADDGTIETTGSVDATFKALGSAITYGAGGPEVQVTVQASTDGGEEWTDLFGGNDIDGGEEQILGDITSGQHIVVKVNGRYGWLFNKTYRSNDGSGRIHVLRNGDTPPDYQAFDNQANLTSFMSSIIDANGRITIGEHDAVLLMELGTLNSASADFQDAVVLISFAQPAGSCADNTDPKFKISFDRLENTGNGDAAKKVFVGSDAVAYAEDQWIPLTTTDGAIVEDVKGIAAQRKAGYVRVLLHGSQAGSKEIVDARVTFSNAKVHWIENDTTGNNATENPFDGIVNDGAGGDEADVIAGSGSVLFQTRVTGEDDAILVYWQESEDSSDDDSSDGTGSSSSAGSSASTSSSSSAPDACAAAYTVTNNRITLTEKADISFDVLGSHALYGGPTGPSLQMRLQASTDNGNTWKQLFSYRDVRGGERETLRDVPAGATLLLKVEGRRGWLFKRETISGEEGSRIRFLKKDDAMPNTTAFGNVSGLQSFLKKKISHGKASVSSKELLMLAEIQDLNGSSDFQDAVVLLTLEKPLSEGICGTADEEEDDDEQGSSSAQASSASTSTASSSGDTGSSSSSASADEDRVICHFPPGNPKNSQTLTVGTSAVAAHLAHGDRYGECEGDEDGDGIQNSADLCADTYVPEGVPTEGLLFKRYALIQNEFAFREGPRRRVSEFTLDDTHGCSCEQLIDVAENAKTYRFGQFPSLLRDMRSLFPFYTDGARRYGCGKAVIDMVRKNAK